uniref:Exosome complex component RRP45 n=1 Tax=Culicoides sonorensis TaxID=179676 RepID=A0A336MRQ4_CULSO
MKDILVSEVENNFIQNAIKQGLRLDGRSPHEFRKLEIQFGAEYGSVFVSLGQTKVLAHVTCNITEPKAIRPNEGLLFIKVELGSMASNNYDSKRVSEESLQISRILERAFKNSRCVDLESLCILSEEKVWNIRVDINVLNHDGNVVDCASVACLSALAHFRRPDYTLSGTNVIVHPFSEKDPIPLVLHHHPVTVSFALFNDGKLAIADPTKIEECISEANIVFGINAYKELCGIYLGGITLTSQELLLRCVNKGAQQAKLVVDSIKAAVEKDSNLRMEGTIPNFSELIHETTRSSLREKPIPIQLKNFKKSSSTVVNMETEADEEFETSKVELIEKNVGTLVPESKDATWLCVSSSSSEDSDIDSADEKQNFTKKMESGDFAFRDNDSNDSEEDVKMIIESNI